VTGDRATNLFPAAGGAARRAAVKGLVFLVRLYQMLVSPLLGSCCRYAPSCSDYTVGALRTHGVARGLVLAAWRIVRCHPFAEGGYDPVPPAPIGVVRGRAGRG